MIFNNIGRILWKKAGEAEIRRHVTCDGKHRTCRGEKEIFTIHTPDQSALHCIGKNNVIGLSGDLRFKQLSDENQRLKLLVEDLMADKFHQAQRIMELNDEKSRLKKALAELIVDDQ